MGSSGEGWLALITFGEGLHNNHHARPRAACFATSRRQSVLDLGYGFVRVLEGLGLARSVTPWAHSRRPSAIALEPPMERAEQANDESAHGQLSGARSAIGITKLP